jgi:hypothetical protein
MTAKPADLAKLAKGKKKIVVTKAQDAPREQVEHDTPVHRFVAQLIAKTGIPYRTTAEVAETLGVSTQWVRKVQRQSVLDVPSMATQLGQIYIYLYTPEDVDKIRRYLAERQSVFVNPAQGRVESWEDVVSRRERTPQVEDSA